MKIAPFLLSSILALVAVILSFVSFNASQTNNALQAELLKKQTEIQDLTQSVTLQNQDYQRQAEIINTGQQVAQQLGPKILRDMGYFVAEHKNEKLKAAMVRQKLEKFIPDAEQLKQMNKQLDEMRKQSGQTNAGSTPPAAPASAPSTAPATPAFK